MLLLERGTPEDRAFIEAVIAARRFDPDTLNEVAGRVTESGMLAAAEDVAAQYALRAQDALSSLPAARRGPPPVPPRVHPPPTLLMGPYRWVFFDLFDTLCTVDEEVYYAGKRTAAQAAGLDYDAFITAWTSTSQEASVGKLKTPTPVPSRPGEAQRE